MFACKKYAVALAVIALAFSQANAFTYKRSDSSYSAPDSADLTLTGPGTGGIARPLSTRLTEEVVSVTDYGADPTGVVDATTAITNAYNRVAAAGGGVLFFPPGTFAVSAFPTIAQNGVTIQCSGSSINGGTRIAQNAAGIALDLITITGAHVWVKDCYFSPSAIKTAGYQIKFSGAYHGGVERTRIDYSYNGVYILSSSEVHIRDLNLRYMLGVSGVAMEGTLATPSYAATINDYIADNPYPIAQTTIITWAINTPYTAGQYTYNNGNIYICTTSGTSAGVGTGPSGTPAGATTPQAVFTTAIPDNTAQWKFVSGAMYWLSMGNYAYTLRVNNSALIDGYGGVSVTDAANTGTSYPKFIEINDIEADHNYSNGIAMVAGLHAAISNSWVGSSRTGNGITVATAFKGELGVTNTRIMGNNLNGILLSAGVSNIINGNWITSNSTASSGTYHAISVGSALTEFNIYGNYLAKDADVLTNLQGWGVLIPAAASDYYVVANNICGAENVTGCVSDGGTGIHKTVSGNQ